MTNATGAGFGGEFPLHIAHGRTGLSQVMRCPEDTIELDMACEAQARITPGSAKQLGIRLVLMDIMACGAADLLIASHPQVTWQIRWPVRDHSSHVRRCHDGAGLSRAMTGFAETLWRLLAAERLPQAALFLRTVDGMTVEAKTLGDKMQALPPRLGSRIMHGTFNLLLVRMASDARTLRGRAQQRCRWSRLVDIVATGARDLRRTLGKTHRIRWCHVRPMASRRGQGVMGSPWLLYVGFVVTGTTEIGDGVVGGVCRRASPEVRTLGIVGGVADAAGARGGRHAERLAQRGRELRRIMGPVPRIGHLLVAQDTKLRAFPSQK